MKKIVAVVFIILIVFVGCSPADNFAYSRASQAIDIFSSFDGYGGKITDIELSLNGEMYLSMTFAKTEQVENSVKVINIEAIGEKAYNDNKRVFEIYSKSKNTCVIYVPNVNNLMSEQVYFNSGDEFYMQHGSKYSSTQFTDSKNNEFAIENLTNKQRVYKLNDVPSVQITVSAHIVSSTSLGRQKIEKSQIMYVTDEAVIVIEQDFSLVIILGVVFGCLIVAGIVVFIFKVKFFSRVKGKKKNTMENDNGK